VRAGRPGEAPRRLRRVVVNPSGGLLSKGEPMGASALGQVVEIVHQLRGDAGDPRQVENAARRARAHGRPGRQRGVRDRHALKTRCVLTGPAGTSRAGSQRRSAATSSAVGASSTGNAAAGCSRVPSAQGTYVFERWVPGARALTCNTPARFSNVAEVGDERLHVRSR